MPRDTDCNLVTINGQLQTAGYAKSILARKVGPGAVQGLAVADGAQAGEVAALGRRRIKQSQKPLMNKLETEWYELLKKEVDGFIRPQALTFRLGNGLRFTPDFTYSNYPECEEIRSCADEVKGKHAWDDSIAKLKVAAALYPEWRWRLCWKDSEGQWQTQVVLP